MRSSGRCTCTCTCTAHALDMHMHMHMHMHCACTGHAHAHALHMHCTCTAHVLHMYCTCSSTARSAARMASSHGVLFHGASTAPIQAGGGALRGARPPDGADLDLEHGALRAALAAPHQRQAAGSR
eukprot:scaffold3365_cov66-Phaeocystis_antarctica.AAC.8